MKATRSIVPVLVVLTVLVAAALAIGMMGRGGQGQQGTELVDSGPNAGLSNEELVSTAITNMTALKSYWLDFEGLKPAGSADPTTHMTMSGYELVGKGLKLTLTGERTTDLDAATKSWTTLDIAVPLSSEFDTTGKSVPGYVEVIMAGNDGYFSLDRGKTWRSGEEIIPYWFTFICSWNPDAWGWDYGGTDKSGPQCGAYVDLFKSSFSDAEPRTEVIDGVPVRHLTTNMKVIPKDYVETYPGPVELGPQIGWSSDIKAATLDVWVSTDATPRIARTRYEIAIPLSENYSYGEPTPTTNGTYSLDWKWSRFNQDLGEVKPPPSETIK